MNKTITGVCLMQRFLLSLFICLLIGPGFASAKDSDDKYVDVSLAALTKLSAHYNSFDLRDPTTFAEYLKLTDCEIYKSVSDSPFKQQEIQQAVLKQATTSQKESKELYFRLPIMLQVSGYNFDTQSLPIIVDSQFKKVNILELTTPRTTLCNRESTVSLTKIPAHYVAKLNFPISLYRVPIQRNIAESVFNRLDRFSTSSDTRVLYGYMLVQIDTIQPEMQPDASIPKALVRAQVNAINLYMDQNRMIPFKRLDFSENF